MAQTLVTIGLGANLGNPIQTLQWAVDTLATSEGLEMVAVSGFYGSTPVDSSGPDYVNAVMQARTSFNAFELLEHLQQIEQQAGRTRPYRNAPRTLDLDLLLYGDAQINTDTLTVPHPRMLDRAFVLQPLAEIDVQWVQAAQHVADLPGQRVWRL